MSELPSEQDAVDYLAGQFLERLRRGERPSLTEYTEKYPEHAHEIRDLFPAMALIERLGPRYDQRRGGQSGDSSAAGKMPAQLGEYRILREIGRGGMGVVYEAEQLSLGRHVAIKVLPFHGLMDEKLLKRFQHEARSAARLHHTNIVPVFGVGEHEGVHYYAMQFIHGQSLDGVLREILRLRAPVPGSRDDSSSQSASARSIAMASQIAQSLIAGCEASDLGASVDGAAPSGSESEIANAGRGGSVDQTPTFDTPSTAAARTDLTNRTTSDSTYFRSVARIGVQVAEALAYAHSQGVLHRDIKPSNLLLDAQGIVWVTDFGLAKQEGEDLTQSGDIVGTLRYMAPERFRGASDSRSDVYGLGITLYELLTLQHAFDAPDRAHLVQQITQADPAHPRKRDRRIPHDLETIVLKAIEKEPKRRYQQASEMVDDLRHFLAGEPIRARRAGVPERVWKWMKRRPAAAALLSLLVLFALSMAGVSLWLSAAYDRVARAEHLSTIRLARSQEAEAAMQREAEKVRFEAAKFAEINRFLLDMLGTSDPNKALGRDISVREVLDIASNRLATELQDQPEIRATLHDTIGWIYRNLGSLEAAERHLRTAIEIRRGLHDGDLIDLAVSLQHFADLVATSGFIRSPEKSQQALAAVREATAIRESALGPDDPLTVYSRSRLGQFEWTFGSPEESEKVLQKVIEGVGNEFPFPMAELEGRLMKVRELWSSGQREEAMQFIRDNVAPYKEKLRDPDLVIQGLQGLAGLARVGRNLDVAEPLHRAALELCRENFGDNHPFVATVLHSLGATMRRHKNYAEAQQILEESLEMRRKLLGDDHPDTILTLGLLCSTLSAKADYAGEVVRRCELLDAMQSQLGSEDAQVTRAKENLSLALFRSRRYTEAEPLDWDVMNRRIATLPPDHADLLRAKRNLGNNLFAQKKYSKAENIFRETWLAYDKSDGSDNSRTLQVMRQYADTLRLQEKFSDAEPIYRKLLETQQQLLGAESPKLVPHLRDLAEILWKTENYTEGIVHVRAILGIAESDAPDAGSLLSEATRLCAWWLAFCPDPEVRNPASAVDFGQRAVRANSSRAANWQVLGMAQYSSGDAESAIQSLDKSCQLSSGGGITDHLYLTMAYSSRGDATGARHSYEKAMQLWAKLKPRNADANRLRLDAESALADSADAPR